MPFVIRPYRRSPVCCPVTYHAGLSQGSGTVWNISLSGWRLSGDLPLHVGQTCSLCVTLSKPKRVFVVAGMVRWVRGEEYGVQTFVANAPNQALLVHDFRHRAQERHDRLHIDRRQILRAVRDDFAPRPGRARRR